MKRIGPQTHGLIDYGFVTLQAVAPTLFHLKGPARTLCYAFSGAQGLLNTFTDHPAALKKVIPFRLHGQMETPFVPALLLLPYFFGAFRQRYARIYFLSFFTIALTNYLLTDYQSQEKK